MLITVLYTFSGGIAVCIGTIPFPFLNLWDFPRLRDFSSRSRRYPHLYGRGEWGNLLCFSILREIKMNHEQS
jgi:hypothetical protein